MFLALLTLNIWEKYVPMANYIDEAVTLYAFYLIIFKKCSYPKQRLANERWMMICFGIVMLFGLASTIVYRIQPQFAGVWRDAFAVLKFPICYYAFYTRSKYKECKLLNIWASRFSKIFVYILGFCGLINLAVEVPIFSEDFRYGFPLYRFIYSHATFMVSSAVVTTAILVSNGVNKNFLAILSGILAIVLSFRSKPLFCVFALVLLLFLKRRKRIRLSKYHYIIFSILVAGLSLYFMESRLTKFIEDSVFTARGAFYINGYFNAMDTFPLGSGFCTFASVLSHKYYSPLYSSLNMTSIWGITEDDGKFAGDAYWPNIYTQYGFIGMFAYVCMLIFLFLSVNRRYKTMSKEWIGAVFVYIYIISACFAESFLTNDTSVLYALVLALFLGRYKIKRKIRYDKHR